MQEIISKILARLIKENESGIKTDTSVPVTKGKGKNAKNVKKKSKHKKRNNRMIIFLLLIAVLASVSFIACN